MVKMLRSQLLYYTIGLCMILAVALVFLSMAPPAMPASAVPEAELCNQYLISLGYATDGLLESSESVIPAVPDKSYENYQKLQKQAGWDLSSYRGRKVMRYSYSLSNFPGEAEGVRANILVCDGEIIGGDICTVALDGFMVALLPREKQVQVQ